MADMLVVAASQPGDPVALIIAVKTGYRLLHVSPCPPPQWFRIFS